MSRMHTHCFGCSAWKRKQKNPSLIVPLKYIWKHSKAWSHKKVFGFWHIIDASPSFHRLIDWVHNRGCDIGKFFPARLFAIASRHRLCRWLLEEAHQVVAVESVRVTLWYCEQHLTQHEEEQNCLLRGWFGCSLQNQIAWRQSMWGFSQFCWVAHC